MGLTAVSWVAANAGILDNFQLQTVTVVVAMLKVSIIMTHFMEISHASTLIRYLFKAWMGTVTTMLIGIWAYHGDIASLVHLIDLLGCDVNDTGPKR